MQNELEKNYFRLFSLPEQFSIDVTDLAARYRELQKQFHPDKFASSPDADRRAASQMAAQINAGYQTLKSPLQRGRYLLELAGIQVDDEKDTQVDTAFLMEQMELREALEEVSEASDPLASLGNLASRVDSEYRSRVEQLADLLQHEKEQFLVARNRIREMQFLEKLAREIEQKEEALLD